jgi:hypothetical protein
MPYVQEAAGQMIAMRAPHDLCRRARARIFGY